MTILENLNSDRNHYRLIEQIEPSSTSVAMNIAEKKGEKTIKEFTRFHYVARASIYENSFTF